MTERYDTVVIGGGQAGLVTGYYLEETDQEYVILDGSERIGDAWRNRWDSLRLFTAARFSALPGMALPVGPHSFPTKDDIADYLETYAQRFELPVELGRRVDGISRQDDGFIVTAGSHRYAAENVVVAMSSFQVPNVPDFAADLDPSITQFHSSGYQNPDQLQEGGTLLVGAGNSGAEIAMDIVDEHPTWLSGRDVGHVPFRIESFLGRHLGAPFVLRVLFHRLLTVDTPIGRRMRPKLLSKGWMLVRVKPKDLVKAGVERVPRTIGVEDGLPVLEDGTVLDVANVIWCTGFRSDFSWIDLPVFTDAEPIEPRQYRGVVAEEPGLYFVGLFFLYAVSSELLSGVGRDAKYVVEHLSSRTKASPTVPEASVSKDAP